MAANRFVALAFFLLISSATMAQNVGLSFSYFVPKHGYISTPVSPFSIRGIGKDITNFLAIQTGASLYRMSGLAMKDLPLKNDAPFIGPNFTIFVPVELVLQLKGNNVQFDMKGGGFFFYGFDQRLNYGYIDRAIRTKESWTVANSSLTYKNNPGFGYLAGAEFTFGIMQGVSLSLEANYLVGQANMPLKGSYTGGTEASGLSTVAVDYKDAKVDFSGWEFSIGLLFDGGGGGRPAPRSGYKKRRR